MTGEMSWNDLAEYSNMIDLTKKIQRECKIAAELKPFDVYQGPFIGVSFRQNPIRKKGIRLLSSWNADVWQDEYNTFIVEFNHKFYSGLFPFEVIDILNDLKTEYLKDHL